jgi:hypothetical protein
MRIIKKNYLKNRCKNVGVSRWRLLKNTTFHEVTLLGTVYVLKKKIKNNNNK